MTFKTFIETVKTAGKIPGSQNNIAIELYEYSGIYSSNDTTISHLKGKRTPQLNWNEINEAGFIQYFTERTSDTWQYMQKAFADLEEHNVIDQDTNEAAIFYRSLLSQFYKIFRVVPITLCHILPKRPMHIGRENELQHITNIFEKSNYAILTGIGGIGKSQIALAYAHFLNQVGDWIIQCVICEENDSLQESILRLQFDGLWETKKSDNADAFRTRIEWLKRRQKNVLIILDNFNRTLSKEDSEAFWALVKCGIHVRILITSRNALIEEKQHIIPILPMDNTSLRKLYEYYRFEDNSGHANYIEENLDHLDQLLLLVENHTLMVILLAKLAASNFLSEKELHDLLENEIRPSIENVHVTKDGGEYETTPREILKKLFNISHLSDTEKFLMRDMSLMPLSGVPIKLFEELTGHSRKDLLSLKRNHWIMVDEEVFSIRLHPLIYEAIITLDETTPSEEYCTTFHKRATAKRELTDKGSPEWHKLSQIAACAEFRIIQSFPLFNRLKDEYRNAILYLHRIGTKYN